MLAVLGGNCEPRAKDIKYILASVGAEAEDERIEKLLLAVRGKDITELIATGRQEIASAPFGGAAVGVAASAGGGGGVAAAASADEPKKEDEVEEIEDSDEDMGYSLFDSLYD